MSIGLSQVLSFSAALFAIGAFGLVSRRSIVGLLLSAELMLMAPTMALAAFSRFGLGATHRAAGPAFAVVIILIAAVELAVGLSIAILAYRERRALTVDE